LYTNSDPNSVSPLVDPIPYATSPTEEVKNPQWVAGKIICNLLYHVLEA
jgi:hypothetical protein